jgi:phytoene desaturase
MKKIIVIGGGFSGLAAATCLAHKGMDVTLLEKNEMAGGRARKFSAEGFTFDMGPSWYWMPDVFEKYFGLFGKKVSDYYELIRLDPSYRIYYGKGDFLDIPKMGEGLKEVFEKLEPGSWPKLIKFLAEAKFKYDLGVEKLVYNPGLKLSELLDWEIVKGAFRLQIFSSLSSHIRKYFINQRIIQLLEFPVLFLGATPGNTPALYSLMNYADMVLGTWYPTGGMHQVVAGMASLAKEQGVKFHFDCEVEKFNVNGNGIKSVETKNGSVPADFVVASADYQYVDQHLLPTSHRKYSQRYWESRTMAPSALMYFIGLNKKLKGLLHHTLFFDQDFNVHAKEIYAQPQWPSAPQFYVSCPSKTDDTVAPAGCENILILIPVAVGLKDTPEIRESYFKMVIERLETLLGENLSNHIIYKRSYAHQDFADDYHAFKGNAYGLANTLMQTANLKPSMINPKIKNLIYTGQLTVPGPGVPPSLISGQVAAALAMEKIMTNNS